MLGEIRAYKKNLQETIKHAQKIAKNILRVLIKYDKTATYSIGWEEGGVDIICFYTRKKIMFNKKNKYLEDVIISVFPELIGHVDCPFGYWLNEEMAGKIKKDLEKLR